MSAAASSLVIVGMLVSVHSRLVMLMVLMGRMRKGSKNKGVPQEHAFAATPPEAILLKSSFTVILLVEINVVSIATIESILFFKFFAFRTKKFEMTESVLRQRLS